MLGVYGETSLNTDHPGSRPANTVFAQRFGHVVTSRAKRHVYRKPTVTHLGIRLSLEFLWRVRAIVGPSGRADDR